MSETIDNVPAYVLACGFRDFAEHGHSEIQTALLNHAEVRGFPALAKELNGKGHEGDVFLVLRFGCPSVRDNEL